MAGKDLPVQVGYDRKAQCPFAHPVPHKGLKNDRGIESIYGVKCLVGDLNRLGYKRVNVKTDQENAIVLVVQKAKEMWPGEMIIEKSPVGESRSNGEAERAAQSIHGLARTLKEHVEIHARMKLDPKSPLIAWIIEHSSNLYSVSYTHLTLPTKVTV